MQRFLSSVNTHVYLAIGSGNHTESLRDKPPGIPFLNRVSSPSAVICILPHRPNLDYRLTFSCQEKRSMKAVQAVTASLVAPLAQWATLEVPFFPLVTSCRYVQ